jgi:GxxExxY protein
VLIKPQMNADERRLRINEIAEAVIGAAFRVSNTLGVGFLEKVYENALAHEICRCGLEVRQQWPMDVLYEDVVVGQYFADLIVEDLVVVEAKAVRAFDDVHLAQCLNYLKATNLSICLLLNFGSPRVDVKRIVNSF